MSNNTYAISALKLSDTYVNTLPYQCCKTAAAIASKEVNAGDFALETGATVVVKFEATNSASNPTLNVSNTGAQAIYYNGTNIVAGCLKANYTYTFVYNGEQWDLIGELNIQDETTVKLKEDLYAYAPIGMAQKAINKQISTSGNVISATNPAKIASQGASLKTVFDSIFGQEQPVQPTINKNNVKLTISSDASTYGGGEFGTAVAEATITYTIKLSNEAKAQYGYRCGSTQTAVANASVYYPAVKAYSDNRAQLKITLPTLDDVTIDDSYVVYKDETNKIVYCNFDSNKEVKFSVGLNSTTVTASQQIRFGNVSAEVTLGDAQAENTDKAMDTTDTEKEITNFLAYKPVSNSYEDSTISVSGTYISTNGKLTAEEAAVTVSAGYVPYAWELAMAPVPVDSDLPSTHKQSSAYTSIPINNADGTKKLYIYIPSNKTIKDIKNNNQTAPSTCDSSSYSLKVNGQPTTFKVYHVNANVASGSNSYTITYS